MLPMEQLARYTKCALYNTTQKKRNTQAVHVLLQLNNDIKGINTLYYKYLLCTNTKFWIY